MAKARRRGQTIFLKTLLPLLLVMVLAVVTIYASLGIGGAFNELRESALDVLQERGQNKTQSFQQMLSRWNALEGDVDAIRALILSELSVQGASAEDMKTDAPLNASILLRAAPQLVNRLRGRNTTGIFLILNGVGVAGQEDTWAGVYIRDNDPNGASADNSDLLMLRGLPPVSRELDIPLDSYWKATFTFDESHPGDYFFKPLRAAEERRSLNSLHYSYWCGPLLIGSEGQQEVMTYSIPMFDENGNVIAVLGVEVTVNYMTTLLNSGEYQRDKPTGYAIARRDGENGFHIATTAGTVFKQHFQAKTARIEAEEWIEDGFFTLSGSRSGEKLYCAMEMLQLYPDNTAFSEDAWVLLSMQPESTVLAFMRRFSWLIGAAGLIVLLLGVAAAIGISAGLSRPISRLALQVKETNPHGQMSLPATGIREIDLLADAIVSLNRDVVASASRMSVVLNRTGLSVGVFDIREGSPLAYCSRSTLRLLGCDEAEAPDDQMDAAACQRMLKERLTDQVEPGVWRVGNADSERYLRLTQVNQDGRLLGALTDVTHELQERRRIEHERDYDVLTGLLNRRAFARVSNQLFGGGRESMGVAAMIMMDLDNLKFVNDTYGHDSGDSYIRAFGRALYSFRDKQGSCLCGRRSGDEFYTLLYGYPDRETLKETIQRGWQAITCSGLTLPDDTFIRFQMSGGMAMYPDDSTDWNELERFADFAMYTVKHGAKGVLAAFNRDVYSEDAFLINGRNALNKLIGSQKTSFDYQPVVSARTGEVLGYELLLRPNMPELPNPTTVLRLAKSQGMLRHIERMTWFGALASAREMSRCGALPGDALIFINSIGDQRMKPEDAAVLNDQYGDLFRRLVVEITESERNDLEITQEKCIFMRERGGRIAIDDYGTGYNSELLLVSVNADFVKVDNSFIHNVDVEVDKQVLVRNLISYARRKGIAVLAEGVETREEMQTLIGFGIDYLQGFYLGRPSETPQPLSETVLAEIRAAQGQDEKGK